MGADWWYDYSWVKEVFCNGNVGKLPLTEEEKLFLKKTIEYNSGCVGEYSFKEKERLFLMKVGEFRDIREIEKKDSDLEHLVPVNSKLAILSNFGGIAYYTTTQIRSPERWPDRLCGRKEHLNGKGQEFVIDSGVFEEGGMGYKIVQSFPWEK